METQTKHVDFTMENLAKCQCMNCPVQANSAWAAKKMAAMNMASMPAAQDTPKVYCSTGTAACGDIDFSQSCICGTCVVWAENGLGNWKYCQNGSAELQG